MFLFTLEFWFWTAVIVVGAMVVLTVLASEAFWNGLAVIFIIGLVGSAVGGLIWLFMSVDLSEIITGVLTVAGVFVLIVLMALMRKKQLQTFQRKRSRTELLDAITRHRVFSAQGIDDSSNTDVVPAVHGFSEEEIARNALEKWRYTLPRQ